LDWQCIGAVASRNNSPCKQTKTFANPDLGLLLSVEAGRAMRTGLAKASLLFALQYNYSARLNAFLKSTQDGITSIALSFDGKTLASGEDGTVALWDVGYAS
jgi:WD40 repeat protein